MRIGRRILVVPEGCRPPAAVGRVTIRVRFGQAFGTGEHPTTRLCLRLLEASLRPGSRVLDLGTGSGILAIAARRLGASRVDAVDDDPVALGVARGNLSDNDVRSGVHLRRCDAARACRGGAFDLVLVNIGPATIARILPDVAAALRPKGRAILSGLLAEQEVATLAAARNAALRPVRRLRRRPWSALLLERRAARIAT